MSTSNYFYYSLLRYWDVRREESLVIGVLLIFPTIRVVRFLCPSNLERLQAAFPDAPIQTIKDYFEVFKKRSITASEKLLVSNNSVKEITKFISDNFLTADTSALQFSDPRPRTGALMDDNIDIISQNLYNRYLETYQYSITTTQLTINKHLPTARSGRPPRSSRPDRNLYRPNQTNPVFVQPLSVLHPERF